MVQYLKVFGLILISDSFNWYIRYNGILAVVGAFLAAEDVRWLTTPRLSWQQLSCSHIAIQVEEMTENSTV